MHDVYASSFKSDAAENLGDEGNLVFTGTEDDPETLVCIANLATLLRETGKPGEAEPYYREALERRRRVLGPDEEQ